MGTEGTTISGKVNEVGIDAKTAHLFANEGDSTSAEDVAEIADTSGASPLPYLTPDAMMLYCQTRLTSINTQCSELMAKQEKTSKTQQTLGQLQTALAEYQEGFKEGDPKNAGQFKELDDAYATAIANVGADSVVGQKLAKDRAEILHCGGDGDVMVGKDEMGSLTNSVKTLQSGLNSESELDMIRLQSLMSQRQTAIQLTTNIVQSLNDQVNKIVANIGH